MTVLTQRQVSDANAQREQPRSPGGSLSASQLGEKIRAARIEREMTLKSLSARSGVSPSTLSKIENQQFSPSFQVVQQVVEALGLDLPQLFTEQPGGRRLGRRSLNQKSSGDSVATPTYEHRLLAGDLSHKKMLPFITRVRARERSEFDGWVRHAGEEFFLVLSGEVELHTEFYAPVRLQAGESGYLDSDMGHALLSVSDQDAQVVWVVCAG